jgi:hypothetical protein
MTTNGESDVTTFEVKPIGRVESELIDLASAPRQADEGAPEAWLVFEPSVLDGCGIFGQATGPSSSRGSIALVAMS